MLEANVEDGANRRFVIVQLDETPDAKSDVAREGYRTIAELSRQRVRLAGESISADAITSGKQLDVGFRTLKIDASNMKDVYYRPDEVDQASLLDAVAW